MKDRREDKIFKITVIIGTERTYNGVKFMEYVSKDHSFTI